MRSGKNLFSIIRDLLVFEDHYGYIVNCAGFGGKRLMLKGFALVAVSADLYAARRFDGKYDGIFVLKIPASAFTVMSV
ncbi:MAG: hypothetical protein KGI54_13870 [Pseudomonadota bacterium]|nr:hypothetical protein [Pseudomonadota bacterium]